MYIHVYYHPSRQNDCGIIVVKLKQVKEERKKERKNTKDVQITGNRSGKQMFKVWFLSLMAYQPLWVI